MRLDEYLALKPLYYDVIDYDRMPQAYEAIKERIKIPKIIHIVGTNGKGSTGRFLAGILSDLGFSTGHYTSPHIFEFNERIWVNGENVSDEILEETHQRLQLLLPKHFIETLSYFEYTTFLAMLIFSQECEYVVLEAGLGGEYDATNVFSKILSIVTPIGFDHQAFLGTTIDEIAATKINSITKRVLISKQYDKNVYEIASDIALSKGTSLFLAEEILSESDNISVKEHILKEHLPDFQELNLQTALAAVRLLGFNQSIDLGRIAQMPGRCQKITDNITIDVGHNEMAAHAAAEYFKDKKVNLIYNSFADKDFEEILYILSPIIKRVELLRVESPRRTADKEIKEVCKKFDIDIVDFKEIKSDEVYLVFGSFVVVEKFLKGYYER